MKKLTLLTTGILLLTSSLGIPQTKPDAHKAWEHIKYLASNDFKGRKAGTPEHRKAAEYVAKKMKQFGLKPAGEDGTYFQDVTFKNWRNFDQPIRLEVTSPEKRVYFAGRNRDYSPANGTGSGISTGRLMFVGYGIDTLNIWNDYENLDVGGKIVMIVPGTPDSLDAKIKKKWNLDKKIKTAINKGASGAIIMNVAPAPVRRRRGPQIKEGLCPEGFVVMNANAALCDDVFYLCDKSWRFLLSKTIRQQKSYTTSLDVTLEMEAHYTFVDSLTAPNVLGIIPGNDPKLKDEYIILGGHLDHIGVGVDGFVNNGADDDGGSAGVILELVRTLKANNFKPDRSIVFASWVGEELGLVGSRFYTNHPIFPLEKTAVYINMDMVVTGDTDLYIGGMWEFSDFYALVKEKLDEDMKSRLRYRLNYRGSDHSAFLPKGVTAISLRTGNVLTRKLDDEHPEYHHPGDNINAVEMDAIQAALDYHYNVLTNLSTSKENLLDPIHHINFVHKDATVVDLHCDTINEFLRGQDLSIENKNTQIDIPGLKKGAVDLQVFACYNGPPKNELEKNQAAKTVFKQIDAIYQLENENSDDVAIVKNNFELMRLKGTGKVGILIAIEGGYAIENDLRLLRSFYRSGVRMMTLTHWLDTDWADASGDPDPDKGGLTEFGEQVVKEMNKLGMIIDVSHVHDETFRDVMKLSDSPVVASHSCCRALSEHHRNLSDEMLKALAENGGVIGINFAPTYLNARLDKEVKKLKEKLAKKYNLKQEQGDLKKKEKYNKEYGEKYAKLRKKYKVDVKTVVDHIEHVIEVTGNADHVGLGSDYDGINSTPEGLEDVGKIGAITKELMARGIKESDIKKILGGNFVRVFNKVTRVTKLK